ncbi:hypothetical protein JTE90_008012 [Oedothorax gibbosus]|uniref:Uncharacterized protein n=1 Tax=Oedothorax gibbosus TaxID=931172 RepID=A0AAV6UVE4_9ARAC|nr:hypothetical protein JTE90_008012 [Oedothorax gibbosus]
MVVVSEESLSPKIISCHSLTARSLPSKKGKRFSCPQCPYSSNIIMPKEKVDRKKRKEYDKKRREKLNSDPATKIDMQIREHMKYQNRIQKGQVKLVSEMKGQELKMKRKAWKKNSARYRAKKKSEKLLGSIDIRSSRSQNKEFFKTSNSAESSSRMENNLDRKTIKIKQETNPKTSV